MVAFAAGAIVGGAACARHDDAPLRIPRVARVLSAHRGECPPKARGSIAERAARFLAHDVPYWVSPCLAHTEARILRGGCGGSDDGSSVEFVTFERAQPVRFVQHDAVEVVLVRTFGEKWEQRARRAILYFPTAAFPRPPLPPGVKPYRGPALYGVFAGEGDPLGLQAGECS